MFFGPVVFPMHALAVQLARLAGVEPDLCDQPERAPALFGPLTPVSFRLTGPDLLPNAAARIAAAAQFGVVPDSRLTEDQRVQLRALAAAAATGASRRSGLMLRRRSRYSAPAPTSRTVGV